MNWASWLLHLWVGGTLISCWQLLIQPTHLTRGSSSFVLDMLGQSILLSFVSWSSFSRLLGIDCIGGAIVHIYMLAYSWPERRTWLNATYSNPKKYEVSLGSLSRKEEKHYLLRHHHHQNKSSIPMHFLVDGFQRVIFSIIPSTYAIVPKAPTASFFFFKWDFCIANALSVFFRGEGIANWMVVIWW